MFDAEFDTKNECEVLAVKVVIRWDLDHGEVEAYPQCVETITVHWKSAPQRREYTEQSNETRYCI